MSTGESLLVGTSVVAALARLVACRVLVSRSATAVTGLAALASGLGGELRILGEAALLVRHTLSALASRFRRKRAVLREAAFRARNTLSALATGFGRETAILGEAALRVRDGLATHARHFPLAFRIHGGETTVRSTSVLSPALSHHHTPLLLSKLSAGARPSAPRRRG